VGYYKRQSRATDKREFESFSALAVIASFIQSLSIFLPVPSINPKRGQLYVSRKKDLTAELDPLKTEIDLFAFAVPIDNLLEPSMADGPLNALDQFAVDKRGTKMGFLYQDLIESCVLDIEAYYKEQKEKLVKNAKVDLPPMPVNEHSTQELRAQQRRQKDKTGLAHFSVYDIARASSPAKPETMEQKPVFKVK
jgi:hypothetical protein